MIYIGSDHAGYQLKEHLKKFFKKKKIKYLDLSPKLNPKDDYPDIGKKVAYAVKKRKCQGVLICGTGMGISMAANKVQGIRAALVNNNLSAKLAKEHNNANIICLGGKTTSSANAQRYFMKWYKGKFSKEKRHHRRVRKLNNIRDNRCFK